MDKLIEALKSYLSRCHSDPDFYTQRALARTALAEHGTEVFFFEWECPENCGNRRDTLESKCSKCAEEKS